MNYLDQVLNGVEVTLSTGYDNAATTVVLSTGDGAKLPDPTAGNYNLVWFNSTDYKRPFDDPNVEIIRVTSKSTDSLSIVRPAAGNSYNGEGSANTAKTHNTGGKTYKMILGLTRKMIEDIDSKLKTINETDLSLTDITTANVSITKHGLMPKLPNDTAKFFDGTGSYDTIKDTDLVLSDVTNNNVSTSAHGFVPKAPNDTTKYLRGDGTWAQPSGGGTSIIQIIKIADETVNNSTLYQNDDHLVMTLAASSVYLIDFMLMVNTNSAANFKAQLTAGGVLWEGALRGISGAGSLNTWNVNTAGDPITLSQNQIGNTGGILAGSGVIYTTNAITLSFSWAQYNADVSDTIVKKGSFIKLIKQ